MIKGVQKLVVEVEDQDRALRFWTGAVGFEVAQDVSYGEERWLDLDGDLVALPVVAHVDVEGEPLVGLRDALTLEPGARLVGDLDVDEDPLELLGPGH